MGEGKGRRISNGSDTLPVRELLKSTRMSGPLGEMALGMKRVVSESLRCRPAHEWRSTIGNSRIAVQMTGGEMRGVPRPCAVPPRAQPAEAPATSPSKRCCRLII